MMISILAVIFLLGKTTTGYYGAVVESGTSMLNVIIACVIMLLLALLTYAHRNDIKAFGKNLLGVAAILAGFYGVIVYVGDLELISAIIAITFGVWAIIWTLNARSVLSSGSSMRKYANSFFLCLIFMLLFSVWDISENLLKFEMDMAFVKYILLIVVYSTFVFASYRIYKLGREFGFAGERIKMKKILKKKK